MPRKRLSPALVGVCGGWEFNDASRTYSARQDFTFPQNLTMFVYHLVSMKKYAVVLLLFITTLTKSYSQIDMATHLVSLMVSAGEKTKTDFPLYYAFDREVVTKKLKKEWKKESNRQFDSLSKEIAKHEKDPELYFKRGLVKERMGADQGAKEDFDRSFQLGNRKREIFMKLGRFNYAMGHGSISISYFNSVLKKDSTDADAYLHRGIAKLYYPKFNGLKERMKEAVSDFSMALKYHPDYKPALIMRGYANHILKARDASIVDLTTAAQLTPKEQVPYVLLGRMYIETKQPQMACNTFTKAVENGVEVPATLLKKACKKRK
jgi:tetratricopeptide (TPR) repeat protein